MLTPRVAILHKKSSVKMIHWDFLGNMNGILMGTLMWDMNGGHWWGILYQHHWYTWTNMDIEATAFYRFLCLLATSTSLVTLVSIIPTWDGTRSTSFCWWFSPFCEVVSGSNHWKQISFKRSSQSNKCQRSSHPPNMIYLYTLPETSG